MAYRRTQKGRFHYLLAALAALLFGGAAWMGPPASVVLLSVGLLMTLGALSFARLSVTDAGDRLRVAFGPVPLFRREVSYSEVRGVALGRSDLLDGLGIHWIPRRGWIWNISGTACVELELEGGKLRIGTDDPDGLADHIRRSTDLAAPV